MKRTFMVGANGAVQEVGRTAEEGREGRVYGVVEWRGREVTAIVADPAVSRSLKTWLEARYAAFSDNAARDLRGLEKHLGAEIGGLPAMMTGRRALVGELAAYIQANLSDESPIMRIYLEGLREILAQFACD